VELFEREVVGRIPEDVPPVRWEVYQAVDTQVGGHPVVAKLIVGRAEDPACPELSVAIRMAVVTPANAPGPVPVLMMFGFGNLPDEPLPRFPFPRQEPPDPPSTEQLIAQGWGYASISTASIQPDNGAGLTRGIIGLTNCGRRRTPEQWG